MPNQGANLFEKISDKEQFPLVKQAWIRAQDELRKVLAV